MNKQNLFFIWTGIIACWIFFVLDIGTDLWFGSLYPGYDWVKESVSYLGQEGSPIMHFVRTWGILFTVLLLLFSIAVYQTYKKQKGGLLATFLLVLYALGEGVGSGMFPINPVGAPTTTDGLLHNIFGGIGDAGLVLLPFVLMLLFPKKVNSHFYNYLWSVVFIGLLMASFFLIAKFFQPDNFILHFKGVWQRIYLLNYHLMLTILSFRMVTQIKNK